MACLAIIFGWYFINIDMWFEKHIVSIVIVTIALWIGAVFQIGILFFEINIEAQIKANEELLKILELYL